MNLPNRLTVLRILMVPVIILLYIFPYAQFGIRLMTFDIGIVTLSIKDLIVLALYFFCDENTGIDKYTVERIVYLFYQLEQFLGIEDSNVICGYHAVINNELCDDNLVRALIEVKVTPQRDGGFDKVAQRIARFPEVTDLYLVSGGYDLQLEVCGRSLQEIASFVSAKLSTIEGIISCSTFFMLKKYKESGRMMNNDPELERLAVSP